MRIFIYVEKCFFSQLLLWCNDGWVCVYSLSGQSTHLFLFFQVIFLNLTVSETVIVVKERRKMHEELQKSDNNNNINYRKKAFFCHLFYNCRCCIGQSVDRTCVGQPVHNIAIGCYARTQFTYSPMIKCNW